MIARRLSGVIRSLVIEHRLHGYRVVTNGPGLQGVTYLHVHLLSRQGDAGSGSAGAPAAARP